MKQILASTLAVIAVASAFPSFAQTSPAAPGAGPERQRMHREDRAFTKPTERIEARLAYVKTALKITPAQETQWNAYAEKMRQIAAQREKSMQDMRTQMQAMRQGQGSRPDVNQRMELRQKFHADAIRNLNDVLAVQKPLVDSLTLDQKRVAEVVLDPRGHGGMRGGQGGHGGRGFQHERHRGEADRAA